MTQGQGALWGGLFAHSDLAERTAANVALKKKCAERGVLPYFVPVGGFMLTPRYDDDPALLTSAVEDLAQCCLEVEVEVALGDEFRVGAQLLDQRLRGRIHSLDLTRSTWGLVNAR